MSAPVPGMLAHWLTECADQGVFTTDLDLRVTSWNAWLERYTGRSADSVVGRPLVELYPELAERHLDLLYRDALGGHGSIVSTALHRYLLPIEDGSPESEPSQRARIVPAIVNGELVGTVTVIDDVSERVAAERQLRRQVLIEHEARTRQALLLKLTDALLTGRHDEASLGRLVFETIGPALNADFGFNYRLDPTSRTLTLVASVGVPASLRDGVRQLALDQAFCGAVAASEQPLMADTECIETDPRGKFVRSFGVSAYACHPLRSPNGGVLGTLSFGSTRRSHFTDEDVAFLQTVSHFVALAWERRRVQEALESSEERFRTVANAAPAIVYVCSPGGEITFVNEKWFEFAGPAGDGIFGNGWTGFIHPDDLGPVAARWAHCCATGEAFDGEVRYRRADGAYRWHMFRVLPERGPDGTIRAWYGCSVDAHEAKLAEEALRATDRQKDEFIALLAHELRNPLAPIRSSMGVMRARSTGDEIVDRCREIVDRQVAQMSRLLDDLLDVSRLSRGKLTLKPETVRLSDVIETAVETAHPLIDGRGHTLHVEGSDRTIVLDADKARLTQVFANLLNNAAKYTEPGGRIDLVVQRVEGGVNVTVRDTGMGIEADLRPRIFEMFSQAGHARDTSGGGLGIGLALAQRLVEMHDGTIDVQSQGPGHGSEFIVHLPATAVPHATESTRPQLSREMDGLVRRRVLVADDNADAADTLAMFLEDLGCDVRTVYDGNEAVVEAERFRPDLMLLDLGMPGLNGQAVCHRVRGESWGADAVIVAITGWGQEADRRRTKIAGFDYHLVKPVEPDVLVQLVRSKQREVSGLR